MRQRLATARFTKVPHAVARPQKPLISRDLVVDAATKIIASEGLDALSLRALGARLNVNSASLYHHFVKKEDILMAVARAALREIDPRPLTESWQDWICDNAVAYRRLLVRKPFLLSLILSGIRPRTGAYAISDAKLQEAGVPQDLRAEFLVALDCAVIGSALVSMEAARIDGAETGTHFNHEAILRRTIQLLLTEMTEQAEKRDSENSPAPATGVTGA